MGLFSSLFGPSLPNNIRDSIYKINVSLQQRAAASSDNDKLSYLIAAYQIYNIAFIDEYARNAAIRDIVVKNYRGFDMPLRMYKRELVYLFSEFKIGDISRWRFEI